MPIDTLHDLRDHIEMAIAVEMSTIPPYLFAMYSIEDQSSEPALLLRSIVVEEMLHAALATNLLLAVGGTPDYQGTSYIFQYPGGLPHHVPPLELALAPCSENLIRDVFMRIEQPETHGAPAEPDEFETLGQFYHALEIALGNLSAEFDVFSNPQTDGQLGDPGFYSPVQFDADDSGGLVEIRDLKTAIEAIEIIVHQGEGLSDDRWADPSHQELTHYHKLLQIVEGESPLGRVINVRPGPRTEEYPESLHDASNLFNASYRYVYYIMSRLFTAGTDQHSNVNLLYRFMSNVLSPIALFLVRREIGDGQFAGPTFEVYEFKSEDPLRELVALSGEVANQFPELAGVRDALAGVSLR
jgi:hypothetical protein